jgi:hypothetical protein
MPASSRTRGYSQGRLALGDRQREAHRSNVLWFPTQRPGCPHRHRSDRELGVIRRRLKGKKARRNNTYPTIPRLDSRQFCERPWRRVSLEERKPQPARIRLGLASEANLWWRSLVPGRRCYQHVLWDFGKCEVRCFVQW